MLPSSKIFPGNICPYSTSEECPLGIECCPFKHSSNMFDPTLPPLSDYKSRLSKPLSSSLIDEGRLIPSKRNTVSSTTTHCLNEAPRIVLSHTSRIPWKLRQMVLDKIYETFSSKDGQRAQECLSIEENMYNNSTNAQVYRSLFASKIQELRSKQASSIEPTQNLGPEPPTDALNALVHEKSTLIENGYLFPEHSSLLGLNKVEGNLVNCARCNAQFDPISHYKQKEKNPSCRYHYGPKLKSNSLRLHSCCHRAVGELGCTEAPLHVYSAIPDTSLFKAIHDFKVAKSPAKIIGLDAEMVYTENGTEIARLSIVDWNLKVVLDCYIIPPSPIVDYNTRYSGIFEDSLKDNANNVVKFDDVLPLLKKFVGASTILVGHSLENDLKVLELTPSRVIDTAILFPHESRASAKRSLKDLSKIYLKEFIQEGSSGHDSIQDARTCISLVKKHLKLN